MTSLLSAAEAVRRIEKDRDLLVDEVAGRPRETLAEPFTVAGGPLGDFCDSLHDLVAHVLMWDQINLSVLTEARQKRDHWSLDPRWETPEAGKLLNWSGVAAGRELPADLVLHQFATTRDALVNELQSYPSDEWTAHAGPLAQYVMTVPSHDAYWHAAIHLRAHLDMKAL